MASSSLEPSSLAPLILSTRTPLVLHNFQHNWQCFQRDLEEWCELWDKSRQGKPLRVTKMSIHSGRTPQWERKRSELSMSSCVDILRQDSDNWYAFSYQSISDLPPNCSQGIDFKCFGFPELPDDATFWLCSRGANTPCHYDTYGCNIVMQIYGRKSWLLFPPDTPLTCTRIPYEESSVYCLENFYSPSANDIEKLYALKDYVHHIILEPNDVLIVPHHWWHYVEAVENCLSINTWIPLRIDNQQRINECIVKYLMESLTRTASQSIQEYIFNPNQLSQIIQETELFDILEVLLKQQEALNNHNETIGVLSGSYEYQKLTEQEFSNLMANCSEQIEFVQKLSLEEYKILLDRNSKRDQQFNQRIENKMKEEEKKGNVNEGTEGDNKDKDLSPLNSLQEQLINSICSPMIINAIATEFQRRWNLRLT